MKKYKTIKGYINAIRRIECNGITCLKGYDKLSKAQQEALGVITAEISNTLGEFDDTSSNRN
jgi:hypothetical protein